MALQAVCKWVSRAPKQSKYNWTLQFVKKTKKTKQKNHTRSRRVQREEIKAMMLMLYFEFGQDWFWIIWYKSIETKYPEYPKYWSK